jgi:hypothetical protein
MYVPEWAELALDKIEWRELLQSASPSRDMKTASRRQSATTRVVVWGSIVGARRFSQRALAQLLAHKTTKWDVHHAGLARYGQGVVGG